MIFMIEISNQYFDEQDDDFDEYKKVQNYNRQEQKQWLLEQVREENIEITGFYATERRNV